MGIEGKRVQCTTIISIREKFSMFNCHLIQFGTRGYNLLSVPSPLPPIIPSFSLFHAGEPGQVPGAGSPSGGPAISLGPQVPPRFRRRAP